MPYVDMTLWSDCRHANVGNRCAYHIPREASALSVPFQRAIPGPLYVERAASTALTLFYYQPNVAERAGRKKSNMKYHFVYGQPDVGKTTTILTLFKALLVMGGKTLEYRHIFDDDFQAIVSYLRKNVAIYSLGDECKHLRSAIEFTKSCSCEILVAAVRKGTHYNTALDSFGIKGEEVRWHEYNDLDGAPASHSRQNEQAIEILKEITFECR